MEVPRTEALNVFAWCSLVSWAAVMLGEKNILWGMASHMSSRAEPDLSLELDQTREQEKYILTLKT